MTKIVPEENMPDTSSKKHHYFPLQVESEEEITLKAIESKPLHAKEETLEDPKTKDIHVYFKYAMLIGLYVMQGIPLGLVFGSIPYMLKSEKTNTLSYSQFGLFSLAGYPYSLKLLWSPLVDQIYSRRIGRRKSWILPVQAMVGVLFYILGRQIDAWIVPGKPVNFWKLNGCFVSLVTLCATLDVAVDGWALTLLPSDKLHYASTCQSVGVNIGLFISFTIFLGLSSARFCTQFLKLDKEIFTLGSFMRFWAVVYGICTAALIFIKEGQNQNQNSNNNLSIVKSIGKGYKTLIGIIKLPTVKAFAAILLSFKFGFSAYDAVAPLKLLEKGFPREFLALTVLIDFPFQMVMGFLVSKWSAGPKTFRPWIIATYCRILMSLVGLYVISKFPASGQLNPAYTALIISTTVLTSFCHTAMFVSLAAYFVKISDARYGGTYLTLLNTLSNFAGMWPKLPVMSAVDWLSVKKCTSAEGCVLKFDGFYLVATACLMVGLVAFQFWIKPAVQKLEQIPKHKWTVFSTSQLELINA